MAKLASTFLTRKHGQPVTVDFNAPVAEAGFARFGAAVAARRLSAPSKSLALNEQASAGTGSVAVAARTWEVPTVKEISWFPAGTQGDSGRNAGPRHQDHARHEDHADVLEARRERCSGRDLPPVTPHKAGAWHEINSHTIQFVPQGYGYGLGADVRVSLPEGVNLVGGQAHGSDPIGQWTVPDGSTLALQQLLAQLGYLPVNFTPRAAATTSPAPRPPRRPRS